jgi:uncharacterized membrane protein
MRSIAVQLPPDSAERVLRIALDHGSSGERCGRFRDREGGEMALVEFQITNESVGGFIAAASEAEPRARFVFAPGGVLVLEPPLEEVSGRVRDVSARSTLELTLGAMQSLGSWRGLLLYAATAGVVVAYALIFNVPWLLTAAMLISPMGGPAMVGAVAAATGDARMLGRGTLRFWTAIAVLAASAATLAAAYGLDFSTATMELISSLSLWVVLIAVAGGVAGALAQIQSERDSLVTATATGFLVAVSLSPPAGVLGVAAVIGRWDYALQMGMLLLLTFAGILLGGTLVLIGFGVRPDATIGGGGSSGMRNLVVALTTAAVAGLLLVQAHQAPAFNKADMSRDAVRIARDVVQELPGFHLLQVEARFTRPQVLEESEALLVHLWVADRHPEGTVADRDLLRRRVEQRVSAGLQGVTPFVEVIAIPDSR